MGKVKLQVTSLSTKQQERLWKMMLRGKVANALAYKPEGL